MIKKILVSFSLVLLTNCGGPATALLGPAFTGATTKSIAQTTLSFSTNHIVQNIKDTSEKGKKEINKVVKKIDDFTENMNSDDFYTSVRNLYLQDQRQKKERILFHR